MSSAGNGAVILTYPDAPVDLKLNPTFVRTSTQLSISWNEGPANGGTPVTSYRIYFDQGVNNWILLASGVTTRTFTQGGLAFGLTY
jgi:hypothetical protein